jgi:hypothetical protein
LVVAIVVVVGVSVCLRRREANTVGLLRRYGLITVGKESAAPSAA